jgi:hypothetical protein
MMNAVLLVANIGVVGFLAWRWWRYDDSAFRKIYWPALLLKIGAGLLLGYVYSYHYVDSDTVRFFDSSIELTTMARQDFGAYMHYLWSESDAPYSGENRTIFFVKLVSLFALATNDNYWLVSVYFSLFSFFSAWHLTRLIASSFPSIGHSAVLAFLIFPSCVFWSSGVIKETAAVAALYFLVALLIDIWLHNRVTTIFWMVSVLSLWLLWSLKYYYAAVFVPVGATAVLTRWFVENRMRPAARSAYREYLLFIVLLMVMFFVVTFIHPNFYPQRMLEVIVENYYLFVKASEPSKVIHFYNLEATLGSIMVNMPWAFISGLFRPFLLEASNTFQVLVSLENLLLLVLTALSVRNLSAMAGSKHRILIFAAVVYCFLLCAFLTLSAPNFGTLVRYRIGFLPFFVLLVGYQLVFITPLAKFFKSRGRSL